jgi:hypothetical protein
MNSNETFLSVSTPDAKRYAKWWQDFCRENANPPDMLTISKKLDQYNGTVVRGFNNYGRMITGIEFKTKKDKLFFQLKFQ